LLAARIRLGELDAQPTPWDALDDGILEGPAHLALSRKMAGESIVLLQNRGGILPLAPAGRIALVGPNADDREMMWGNYNAIPDGTVTLQDALQARVGDLVTVRGCGLTDGAEEDVLQQLEGVDVVIFAGGTGNPYFTTDSCATLRALEVGANAILMAKNGVDGVFDSDPRKNPNAKMYKHLTFHQVVEQKLGVMDLTAMAMLEGKDLEIRVFNMDDENNFMKVLAGEDIGTTISKE
jgi:hypothetical protein